MIIERYEREDVRPEWERTNLEAFLDEPSYYFSQVIDIILCTWKSKHTEIRSLPGIIQRIGGRFAFGSRARVSAVDSSIQHPPLRSFMVYCITSLRPSRTSGTVKGCEGEDAHRTLQRGVYRVANKVANS